MEQSERIESSTDFSDNPQGLAQRWSAELEASKKELQKFHDDADKITRRFLDKRDEWAKEESRVNLFWSTTKVLLSLLYARPPRASVARSFLDADDDQARVAGQIIQRLLNRSFDDNVSHWDNAVRQGIEDWLVVGMGQIWLRYEVETALEVIPAELDPLTGDELVPEQTYERIVNEDAPVDYIYWKDFFWSPARTWNEVRWVARRVYMTKDQLTKRFGEEIAKVVPLTTAQKSSQNDQAPKFDPWAKAEVFEIWEKKPSACTGWRRAPRSFLTSKTTRSAWMNFSLARNRSRPMLPRVTLCRAQTIFLRRISSMNWTRSIRALLG